MAKWVGEARCFIDGKEHTIPAVVEAKTYLDAVKAGDRQLRRRYGAFRGEWNVMLKVTELKEVEKAVREHRMHHSAIDHNLRVAVNAEEKRKADARKLRAKKRATREKSKLEPYPYALHTHTRVREPRAAHPRFGRGK